MPDLGRLPDALTTPSPDPTHEAYRVAVVEVFDRIADSFLLGQTAFDFAETVLLAYQGAAAQLATLGAAVTAQAQQIAALKAQIAALTPPAT